MSLRAKLLALFAVFGVLPVVAVGVYGYVRSLESVEDLIRERTAAVSTRIADEIESRYALRLSDMLLFADNTETLRLYQTHAADDSAGYAAAGVAADAFLRQAWDVVGSSYRAIAFRDSAGTPLYARGDNEARSGSGETQTFGASRGFFTLVQSVRETGSGREYGSVEATVRLQALLPEEALSVSFGAEGYSAVLDRGGGRVLFHPDRTYLSQPLSDLLGPGGWNVAPDALSREAGSFVFEEDGARRVASFVNLSAPAWMVLSSGSVDEFAAPFARTRALDLSLVITLAATLWIGFLLVTHRLTRSLTALTDAADQVGHGNLAPELPEAGTDEVGRLTRAFGLMLQQIREMLKRIRESRHMAAVGQFASQLSHEIRNPLTSVKLNLQSLQRAVDSGQIHETFAEPVAISLHEIRRLEGVVRGVLSLARTAPTRSQPCSVHASLDGALQVLRPQLEAGGVGVELDYRAAPDTVEGDDERLRGAFLNLFLNAVEAMPSGGHLRVSTDVVEPSSGPEVIRVRIADDGPGVPSELRERIFEPFFSTKEGGTGFGLALAQQTVEEHAGRLTLDDSHPGEAGAVFVVELPLAAAGAHAPLPGADSDPWAT
ncbi:MAG: ATP-binding protein [Longimicrobiales bacterium]|nr:ATP-binding protein [Longimicrobiales bacterium]